ncbi:unnamed protein product, partial [marine sediment metagenome]
MAYILISLIVQNKKNIGLTRSLNKGLKLAKGKYIARQDDSDYSYPKRLEKEYYFLENNKEYGLVGSLTEIMDERNNIINHWGKIRTPEAIFYTLSYRNCLTHASVMFNKKIVLEIGSYNENYKNSQDYELWHRISRKKKIYIIPEYLVKWRKDRSGISIKYGDEQQDYVNKVAINNYGLSESLINYLRHGVKGKSFLIKIKMLLNLNKFHSKIKDESKNVNFNSRELDMICNQIKKRFVIDNFLNSNLKNF